MSTFTQKLQLIQSKLFNDNIDEFTKALIDYKKFKRDKFDEISEKEAKKQFFFNRKTVLRRWLQQGSRCSSDFCKSYPNYKLSNYQLKGEPLFLLKDFQKEDNLKEFEQRVELYLKYQKKTEAQIDYRFIYTFCEISKKIIYFQIIEWIKGENQKIQLSLLKENKQYRGEFQLTDENNILINIKVDNNQRYMLFHESNDNYLTYIVGISMGFLENDNKVPTSQKVVFSKDRLDEKSLELTFMLNESEALTTIENRLHGSFHEEIVNYFITYTYKLKKISNFFNHLKKSFYKQSFYHRLFFQEFNTIQKLLKRITKNESYYILDFQDSFLELIKTVESIKDIELNIVMQLNNENIFLNSSQKNLEIKSKILNLYKNYSVKTTIIFVLKNNEVVDKQIEHLFKDFISHNIKIRVIEEREIAHEVDSLDFTFIHTQSNKDFVLADPIRDSKNVYKIFIDELTMDEYRTNYKSFLAKSRVYNIEN